MAYKVLGQSAPAANADTTLYAVPASKSSVGSTLVICNRSADAAATVRVAVRPAGEVLAVKHYILWNISVAASDSAFLTIGLTLATTDVVTVRSSHADVSFSLFGQEV